MTPNADYEIAPLVDRLREAAALAPGFVASGLMVEAADEIDWLRAALDQLSPNDGTRSTP